MTHLEQEWTGGAPAGRERSGSSLQNELRAVLGMLRRRARLVIAFGIVGVLATGIYAFTATPKYKASAQVSLDPRRLAVLETPDERRKREEPLFDPARVDSQLEAIKSERLARTVMSRLDLANDPEFSGDEPSLLSMILPFSRASGPANNEEEVLTAMGKSLTVTRVENTFVIDISFLSRRPEKAAQVANAYAEAFVQDHVRANMETTERAAEWLKGRLKELSAQAVKAETAVIDFKRANNMAIADGKSIEEQALTAIGSKLTDAAAATGEAKARLDQITAANRSDTPDLTVADALRNDVITRLRQQYLDNGQRAADFASRYGENHGAVQRLRAENRNILASIRDEMRRIEETYRSDYEVARKREEAIRTSLSGQFDKTVQFGDLLIKLQELQSVARAARQSYDDTTQRYLQAMQRQSFPMSEARLLSAASPPTKKHSPKRLLLIAIGAFGGVLLGVGAAVGTELADGKIRTKRDAEQATDVPCLGFMPVVYEKSSRAVTFKRTGAKPRKVGLPWDYVVRAPFSIGAEVIRGVKVAADRAQGGRGARVIGVISALPGEGKTSVAANLAHLIAHSGARVLLIDGDMRNPALSRVLAPQARVGLPDILVGGVDVGTVTYGEPEMPLYFIPAQTRLQIQHTHEVLGSEAMRRLLEDSLRHYTYVIVDLPPLVPVVDVQAAAEHFDGFALVVEWGSTPRDVVGDALGAVPWVWDKVFGCVLNKADITKLKRYGEYVSHYYNKNYFKA